LLKCQCGRARLLKKWSLNTALWHGPTCLPSWEHRASE
jgi:hypothetical protein